MAMRESWTSLGGSTALTETSVRDSLKELTEQLTSIRTHGIASGLMIGLHSFGFRWQVIIEKQVFTLLNGIGGTETIKEYIDTYRSSIGASAFTWSNTGGSAEFTGDLVNEIRRAIGLAPAEIALDQVEGDPSGAVVKELSPVAYRWPTTTGETGGGPTKDGTNDLAIKRIFEFPESTRKANVETFLIYRHGAGGLYSGNQTWSIVLGDYNPTDASATYNSNSTVFISAQATSAGVVSEIKKITGYPSSGSGEVHLLAQMDDEAGAEDQANTFPLITAFPEMRVWQPELS